MNTFTSIKELVSTLGREYKLLSEMFEKRKVLTYKYDYALEILDYNEERIDHLLAHSVIRQNGEFLEIDDQFLHFFETILEVNEDINTASIHANIQEVKENILYYLQENNESRKYSYLRKVKNTLRKIGNITLRNVVDLKRNSETTFKNEPNYKVKKAKLEILDQKRVNINALVEQTYKLLSEDEQTFFKSALDEELNTIITFVKIQLNECRHNLLDNQKQIIEYLNQIKYQSGVIEKLRQIKYLKDQFIIRATTNIEAVLATRSDLIFESKPAYPLKLSLEHLQHDDAYTSILKVAKKIVNPIKIKLHLAGSLSSEYLQPSIIEEFQINLEEIRNNFLASSNNLFDFLLSHQYGKELSFDEKVTIYCQLVSLYGESFTISDQYNHYHDVEYAMVYPK